MEDFARFLNRHSNLQAHCVSRGLPVNSAQGIRPEAGRLRLPHQPSAQPVLPIVVRMASSPGRASPPVPLSLTAGIAAGKLAITGTGMRRDASMAAGNPWCNLSL